MLERRITDQTGKNNKYLKKYNISRGCSKYFAPIDLDEQGGEQWNYEQASVSGYCA